MKRQAGTLLNLCISIALIAVTIWFLFSHLNSFSYGNGRWFIPHHTTIVGGAMGIIMITFWVAVIVTIAMIVVGIFSGRRSTGSPDNSNPREALVILKARYVQGEIDKVQYQTMKKQLM